MLQTALVKKYSVSHGKLDNATAKLNEIAMVSDTDGRIEGFTLQGGTRPVKYWITFEADQDNGEFVVLDSKCDCGAFHRNKRDGLGSFCVHTLGLAISKDGGATLIDPSLLSAMTVRQPRQPKASTGNGSATTGSNLATLRISAKVRDWQLRTSKAISKAVNETSEDVRSFFLSGDERCLLLSGASGTGKTSAIDRVCRDFGFAFIPFSGDNTTSMNSAFGFATAKDRGEAKAFTIAFTNARNGIDTVLFVDELRRLSQDMFNSMITMIQHKTAGSVRSILADSENPIPDDMPDSELVYFAAPPWWPMQWAPAKNLKWVFACNPWGTKLDPAFVRRCYPMNVFFSEDVLKLFDSNIADYIKATWEDYLAGLVELSIEYSAIKNSLGSNDDSIVMVYLQQLKAMDEDQYKYMCERLGIDPQ
jgi:hypothetical protein